MVSIARDDVYLFELNYIATYICTFSMVLIITSKLMKKKKKDNAMEAG